MKPTAVQFGAGNIGRGFLAQLFHESGLEVVFVDVAPATLTALNGRGEYIIHIVGHGAEDVHISDVRAVDGRDGESVAREIANCQVVSTAVGAGALPHIAPNLAAGLLLRYQEGRGPVNILICENLHDATDVLRSLVASHLPETDREQVIANTGFVQAVVSRMVPLQNAPIDPGHDPLAIRVEAYKRLPIDGKAVVGNLPSISGVEPVENFLAYVERKLYTHNCAHATLGYLGYEAGHEFGYDALADPVIHSIVKQVLSETGAALVKKHGFDSHKHQEHVDDLLARFSNRELGDTCFRLAKDPLRKLAPDDRLVGAARLCESQGVDPEALIQTIGSAFRFDAPEDPSAVQMQSKIAATGIASAIQTIAEVDPQEPLGRRIMAAYRRGEAVG